MPIFCLKSLFSQDLSSLSSSPFFVVTNQAFYEIFAFYHSSIPKDGPLSQSPNRRGIPTSARLFWFLTGQWCDNSGEGSSIYDCPLGKVAIPIPLFKVGLCLLMSEFFDMIVHHYDFSVDELTLSAVNKIAGFEMICRSLGCIPIFWVFSYFFYSTMSSGVHTLVKRRGIHQLISEQDTPIKNWQRQWLWVNRNLVGHGFRKTRDFPDRLPKLFGSNLTL
ncbi:unnamed protein product [Lactuca saligna]|uniref:Uncharacterized protein n=1 Tax=Lactuca saligna TaxID=75948 RepID=A0AA35YMK1_LACSI|nr:unnamed protein product [Lactuca saligna]